MPAEVCSSDVQDVVVWCGGKKCTTSHIMHNLLTHSTSHISYHTIPHHAPIFATMHNIAHHNHILTHHGHITRRGMHSTSHLPSPHYTSHNTLCHNAPHIAHHSHIFIHHGCIACRGMQQWCARCGGVMWWQEMHHISHHAQLTNTFHTTPFHITHQSLPQCTTLHITATYLHIMATLHVEVCSSDVQYVMMWCGEEKWCVIWNVM